MKCDMKNPWVLMKSKVSLMSEGGSLLREREELGVVSEMVRNPETKTSWEKRSEESQRGFEMSKSSDDLS